MSPPAMMPRERRRLSALSPSHWHNSLSAAAPAPGHSPDISSSPNSMNRLRTRSPYTWLCSECHNILQTSW
ncbi:hypothetical protein AB205_0130270 [Aquarana catesbeiana]|uniref:Uncharacterized protein n=1 Tax=Aquarana catesbeiana TaxID=8400 RepID=A0A2G9REZ5_AQUCT|nr:hypothetical protein AB205_0130270 [Aquarana catesbeiana]